MDPLLEVNPTACLFVIGPSLTGSKSCRELLEAALRYLQTTRLATGKAANKRKLIAELKKTTKSNVGAALQRAVEMMKEYGCFSEWLNIVFGDASSTPPPLSHTNTIKHLLELRKQGALLACTQLNTSLDSLARSNPATLEDEESFKKWLSTSESDSVTVHNEDEDQDVNVESDCTDESTNSNIFLHLCGVYTHKETIHTSSTLGEDSEEMIVAPSSSRSGAKLKEILQKRLVIFIGFDGEGQNPFLLKFLDDFYQFSFQGVHLLKSPPILIIGQTREQHHKGKTKKEEDIFSYFLRLDIEKEEVDFVEGLISHSSQKNFSIAKGLSDKQGEGAKFQAFLLFNEKQSFRKLGDIIYHQSRSGEIYVRRDARTVVYDTGRILYSNIITYGGNGLKQLWKLVFADGSNLLGKGLVAFGLQNSAIVWTKGRPAGLGNVSDVASVFAGKVTQSATAIKNMNGQGPPPNTSQDTSTLTLPYISSVACVQPGLLRTRSLEAVDKLRSTPLAQSGGLLPLVGAPPPPKLIPISSEDLSDSDDSQSTKTSQSSSPLKLLRQPDLVTAINNPLYSTLSPSGKHPQTLGTSNLNSKYLQSIVELQERISRQLNSTLVGSTDRLTMAPPDGNDRLLLTPFRPPQYCIASPPQKLEDIISQTPYVKLHEHKIEHMDMGDQSKHETKQPLSLNHTSGSNSTNVTRVPTPALTPQKVHSMPELIKDAAVSDLHSPPPKNLPNKQSPKKMSNAHLPGTLLPISTILNQAIRNAKLQSSARVSTPSVPTLLPTSVSTELQTRQQVGTRGLLCVQNSVPLPHTYNQLTPVAYNQTALPNLVVAPSPSNYCLALNPLGGLSPVPMMSMNPMMQQIHVASTNGLPSNQLVYYLAPSNVMTPLTSQESSNNSNSNETQVKSTSQQPTSVSVHSKDSPKSNLHLVNGEPDRSSSPAIQVAKNDDFAVQADADSVLSTKRKRMDNQQPQVTVNKKPRLSIHDQDNPESSLLAGTSSFLNPKSRPISDDVKSMNSSREDNNTAASTNTHSTLTSDGSIQLWIFLLDLLLTPDFRHIVHWTGKEYEFRIAQPASLAKLWGSHRNKPQMTYEKMSRALRYYYSRGIIESVKGKKQTFRFSLNLRQYVANNKDKKTLAYLDTCCG